MDKLKLGIIIGSTRDGRAGKTVADWVFAQAKLRDEFDVTLLDLAEFDLPLYHNAMLPGMMNKDYPDESVSEWSHAVDGLDAVIIVTPEYNHGYPASLKNSIDWLYSEWADKPVGFVGYSSGIGAGIRAVEQLRQVVTHIKLVAVGPTVQIPFVSQGLDDERYAGALKNTLNELARYGLALKALREGSYATV